MESLKISLIDLDPAAHSRLADELRNILQQEDPPIEIQIWSEIQEAHSSPENKIQTSRSDVLLLILPATLGESERALIRRFNSEPGKTPMIAIIDEGPVSETLEIFKLGITDFITPPFRSRDLMPRLWRLSRHFGKKNSLVERLKECVGLRQLIGTSPVFTAELGKVPFVATCDSSVLITGETGTGKEMFARAIHYLGPRSGKVFMPVNCGAIPVELMENELFGHVRGAYTSAATPQDGIISEADGGTLFLDEIDCLPPSAQVKLLRFLQEKEYRQLGSAKTKRADVRIIAATNIDPEEAVSQGRLRRDLYYRLNIIPLLLPPLRERREDIPLLAKHFSDQCSVEFNKKLSGIAPEAAQKLLMHDWPGNVRELHNIIERAVVFSSGDLLQAQDINLPQREPSLPPESFQEAKARVVVEFERKYINRLLVTHGGNITQAAQTAGKDRRAFWELIRKHNIDVRQFKTFSS